jgi:hypothetical protein
MAKTKMLCPFSKELCRECPQFRGRHYYLCFHKSYRGCLAETEKKIVQKSWTGEKKLFEMPPVLPPSSKWLVLNEFAERKRR